MAEQTEPFEETVETGEVVRTVERGWWRDTEVFSVTLADGTYVFTRPLPRGGRG